MLFFYTHWTIRGEKEEWNTLGHAVIGNQNESTSGWLAVGPYQTTLIC